MSLVVMGLMKHSKSQNILSGKAPRERDGTRRLLPYIEESTESAKTDDPRMVTLAGETARIRMKFSPSCIVGRWKIILQVIWVYVC